MVKESRMNSVKRAIEFLAALDVPIRRVKPDSSNKKAKANAIETALEMERRKRELDEVESGKWGIRGQIRRLRDLARDEIPRNLEQFNKAHESPLTFLRKVQDGRDYDHLNGSVPGLDPNTVEALRRALALVIPLAEELLKQTGHKGD
jgi:hypothetical protein